jgi:hypothetical protein
VEPLRPLAVDHHAVAPQSPSRISCRTSAAS